jgi:MraZ protein
MFTGRYKHSLDDRNRVTIPSRFREALLADHPIVTIGFEPSLVVYPQSHFDAVARDLTEITITDEGGRNLRRLIFSYAETQELDKSGRLLITPEQLSYAGIKDNVVIVGNGDYFEIWSEEHWTNQQSEIGDPRQNVNRFSQYKINSK